MDAPSAITARSATRRRFPPRADSELPDAYMSCPPQWPPKRPPSPWLSRRTVLPIIQPQQRSGLKGSEPNDDPELHDSGPLSEPLGSPLSGPLGNPLRKP